MLSFLLQSAANGQIDQRLLQRGFGSEPHWADTYDEPTYIFGGEGRDSATGETDDIELFYWDSTGRIKLDRNQTNPNFWMGYRFLTLGIQGDFAQVTGELVDVALVGALALNQGGQADSWRIDLAAGAGTANDGHWSNTDAIYGVGTLNAARQIEPDTILNIGVSYHGNRVLFPDIPIPYISLQQKLNPTLSYELGVLNSSVRWDVLDGVRFEGAYITATSMSASLTFDLSKDWSMFCEYRDSIDGFYLNNRNNTRVFYDQRQVAAGFGFNLGEATRLRLGGGYAFDLDFTTGFDIRNRQSILVPDDGAMVFLTIEGTF